MSKRSTHIVVVGTSAGGLEALDELIGQLPPGFPAAIFVVQHMAPENSGEALLHRLSGHKSFSCKLADDGDAFKPGQIYIARPDFHLLVKKRVLLVTKGARENRYRPAIDPLFRSAAVEHGANVIGIVLTGMLDDGTAGLKAIEKCGGVTIVQDPNDATYSEMPKSALNNLNVDHCVPIAEMGRLLVELIAKSPRKSRPIPEDIRTEAEIAERVLSDVAQVNGLGSQVPYNCPNCGGVLWEMATSKAKRYRCHTGHSFTASALLTSQTEKIEETLWIALRMFEERRNLLNNVVRSEGSKAKRSYIERSKETNIHIDRIREMLLARETMHVKAARSVSRAQGKNARAR